MPIIAIEVRKKYSDSEAEGIMDAVHAALVTSFKCRPEDKNVRLIEHAAERFCCSNKREAPDRFTQITIDCIKGRKPETKRKLFREIVSNLAAVGIPANAIEILIREQEGENFGIRGGRAASDIDLGYKIEV